jgi:2-keto-4-pentenoate hydratase/2-oxohepta-3-ene-1,7-dioic acid hydratase in catechol pathway
MSYVAGFSVAHDVSARDWQLKRNGAVRHSARARAQVRGSRWRVRAGGQWLLGKTMDTFAPFGPAVVTPDEVKDPHALGIRLYVNGTMLQVASPSPCPAAR